MRPASPTIPSILRATRSRIDSPPARGGARLFALAGQDGAGKSSLAGAAFRAQGGDCFDPDEAAAGRRASQGPLDRVPVRRATATTSRTRPSVVAIISRLNPIELLPSLAALRLYDDSVEADPAQGAIPRPRLLLQIDDGRIGGPADLASTPDCARPIVAAAMKIAR